MSMLLLMTLLSAAPAVESPSAEPLPANWAVGLKVGVMPASVMLSQGSYLGAYGTYVGGSGPMSGLYVERALGQHFTFELGAAVNGFNQLSASAIDSVTLSVSPALHWYPGRAFDGGWIGVALPLSWSRSQMTSTALDGSSVQFDTRSATVAGQLLLGWTFRWGNRFMASLAAGPTLSVATSRSTFAGTSPPPYIQGGLGAQAFLGAGVAL